MELKDYYARLGVERTATDSEIKRAYRTLARKYHPDVSKEPDAEAQFKAVAEAYKTLIDPDKRAAYDVGGRVDNTGPESASPPGWNSDLFDALFRQHAADTRGAGSDHHAKLQIDLQDSYRGARRSVSLRDPDGTRQLEVNIPKGIRAGQHLRLAGQGGAGFGAAAAGDLYVEIEFSPHPLFRIDDRDVYVDVPVAPWEAALGATVRLPTPDGSVQLKVPPDSTAGRKLRLKGMGLPGVRPGDLYAVLSIVLPPADSSEAKESYLAMAKTFGDFNPRRTLEAT